MRLEEILKGINVVETKGDINKDITGIHMDSRKIMSGDLFVAVKGTQVDGHAYIENGGNARRDRRGNARFRIFGGNVLPDNQKHLDSNLRLRRRRMEPACVFRFLRAF